jgi:hypothetical protein
MPELETTSLQNVIDQLGVQGAAELMRLGDEIANADIAGRIDLLSRFADAVCGGGD